MRPSPTEEQYSVILYTVQWPKTEKKTNVETLWGLFLWGELLTAKRKLESSWMGTLPLLAAWRRMPRGSVSLGVTKI
jgi:hypothetical protein